MTVKDPTFAQLLDAFAPKYDLRPIFDDFLTMAMCAVTPKPGTGESHDEDLYLQTIAKYKDEPLRHNFPHAFARLVIEMEQNLESPLGNDVLGNYYEQSFSRKHAGQFFTPWPVCQFMAQITIDETRRCEKTQRMIDPACGSGRLLLAGAKILGPNHEYYGIDLDHTCVKMAALNLFLNGVFHSEVMWADALMPGNFNAAYKVSFLPLGIFRTDDREHSTLWHMHNASFRDMTNDAGLERQSKRKPDTPQLKLF